MHLDGARNIAILTGFLAATDQPGVRRLFQNIAAATYTLVVMPGDAAAIAHMAPVDLSGPVVLHEGEPAVRADWIRPATAQSISGCRNFIKTSGAGEELERIDFDPNINWQPSPAIVAQLTEGPSTWGIGEVDEMAGWIRDGIQNPPRQRLMNRVILTGLPADFGRRIDTGDRIYNPCTLLLGDGTKVEVRLYNDMRQWSSVARIVAGAVSPITVVGTLRAKFDRDAGGRKVFIDAVDVYAANTEDLPAGVPAWMSQRIRERIDRRAINLAPASSESSGA